MEAEKLGQGGGEKALKGKELDNTSLAFLLPIRKTGPGNRISGFWKRGPF